MAAELNPSNPQAVAPALRPLIPDWMDELQLRPAAFRVLCKLWRHAPGRGRTAVVWPSRAEIIRTCGINKDTLNTALNELDQAGLLQRKATWRDGKKHVQFHLLTPGTIIRKEGTMVDGPLSESEGRSSSEKEGLSSSESEGIGSIPMKLPKEVCVTHTQPSFLEEVQAKFLRIDCEKCWPKFFEHSRLRNLEPTQLRFETWCSQEKVNVVQPTRRATLPDSGPAGWQPWLASNMPGEDESAFGQLKAALNNSAWHMVPASWQERFRIETSERRCA